MELQTHSSIYHKGGAADEERKIRALIRQEDMTPSRRKTVNGTFNRFFVQETRVAPRRALRQQIQNRGVDAALPKTITFTEQARIETLLKQQESRVASRIRAFMRDIRSPAVISEVSSLLEARNITGVLNVVDGYVKQVGQIIPQVFTDIGVAEAEMLTLQIGGTDAAVAVSFNPADPRAAARMKRSQLTLIREVNSAQRLTVRNALQEALTSGLGPRGAAQAFKDSVGLTQTQNRAVENYRRLLESNSKAALNRGIRDRRFDSTVRGAIATDTPLSSSVIQRMVDRYRAGYLNFRSETIARTETLRVANEARDESLRQSLEQTGTPKANVRRQWLTAADERVRDPAHTQMNGQIVGLEEMFTSGIGNQLQFPGDMRAPAEDTINCRCVVVNEIKKP